MIAGCVRRARASLEARGIKYVDGLAATLGSSAVYIFEDDEIDEDGTRSLVLRWTEQRPRVRLIVAQPPVSWQRARCVLPSPPAESVCCLCRRGWQREQRVCVVRQIRRKKIGGVRQREQT